VKDEWFLVKRVARGRRIFPTLNSLIGTLTLSWMVSMSPAFGLPRWLNSFFLGWAGSLAFTCQTETRDGTGRI
jgi:hypothetical protein